MIVCPRCSYENEDSDMNCVNCRISLQWAMENLHEAARDDLERGERPPEAPGVERVPRVENKPIRGFLVIVSLLAAAGSLVVGCQLLSSRLFADFPEMHVWMGLLVIIVGGSLAATALLRREPKPDLGGGLRLLIPIALVGGLGYGLMHLVLAILPEHTGQSLVIQYKLGERDFGGASLRGADLSGADLHGAKLQQADLSEVDLVRADLRNADLIGAHLRNADLRGANLNDINLSASDLTGADLSSAKLFNADLSEANLWKADLSGATLYQADLSGAYVAGADLSGANLSGANLGEAFLSYANLRGATVTAEQLAQVKSLSHATMPDGTSHK